MGYTILFRVNAKYCQGSRRHLHAASGSANLHTNLESSLAISVKITDIPIDNDTSPIDMNKNTCRAITIALTEMLKTGNNLNIEPH